MTVSRLSLAVCRLPLAAAVAACVLAALVAPSAAAAPVPDSKRLAQAKDYVADEQWLKAVAELRAAVDDPKEPNRDEALFWLAHSQHQAGDQPGALDTIARLERTFPKSPWVRPARSLRIEIAQQLNRDDVLWHFAFAPAPPIPAVQPAVAPTPTPAPTPPAARPPRPAPAPAPPTPVPPPPGAWWVPESYVPDIDVRIQALGSLIQSSPDQVIPMLKAIALDSSNTAEGRRAVLVLAQSDNPQAEVTVFELARRAAEPVRLAAIREMGRLDSSNAHTELLQIARTEADPAIRDTAIVTLGRAGARQQLRTLYGQMDSLSARLAVLTALFNTHDEDELIRIATTDKSPDLRAQARRQLALLGTPKAKAFLARNKQ